MSDRAPDLDQPVVLPPIAEYPELGEGVTVTPQPSLPDELAYTGPLDVVSAAIGGAVLLWAGLALRGRRSPDSEEV